MNILNRSTLSCLYYPYADPQPSPSVLMAALLFDRVYYLEPNFFRKPIDEKDKSNLYTLNSELEALNVFHKIGPDVIGINKLAGKGATDDINIFKELQASIQNDLVDDELIKIVQDHGKVHWYIPNGQYLFWNGLGIIFEFTKGEQNLLVPEVFTSRLEFYKDFISKAEYKVTIQPYEDIRLRNAPGELMIKLPYLAAEALMISVTLNACREFNLIPFTDNPLHQKYLLAKIRKLGLQDSLSEINLALLQGTKYRNIGNLSMEISIPKIENLSPEKVYKIRNKCSDELLRFRSEILRLTYDIESQPWDSNYESQIQAVINTKVEPAVTDLKDKLHSLKHELGLNLLEKTVTTSPLPFLINITAGFPIEWVLPASVGTVWLKEWLAYYQKKGDLKKNGFSFLLNL